MGKIIILSTVLYASLYAGEVFVQNEQLESKCFACHRQEQIPSEMIYRRYLMTYSTHEEMQKAIFEYLKHPQKENSIMPPPFFIKFPMKEAMELDDAVLKEYIRAFLDHFDVKKRLTLP